jgi:hypothetical protein
MRAFEHVSPLVPKDRELWLRLLETLDPLRLVSITRWRNVGVVCAQDLFGIARFGSREVSLSKRALKAQSRRRH